MRTLIIMRGIPGSGKTTHARSLQKWQWSEGKSCTLSSADFFFEAYGDHVYRFDASKLKYAHAECINDFAGLVLDPSVDTIIVDNTNTQLWEFVKYLDYAHKHGKFHVDVFRMEAPLDVCQKRCVHGVPPDKIQQMRDRFEDFPGEEIINNM
jgi:tRNA uridine 5-carbamoylmethylation protein Kti12